jgi:hypothetical protein
VNDARKRLEAESRPLSSPLSVVDKEAENLLYTHRKQAAMDHVTLFVDLSKKLRDFVGEKNL